MRKREILKEMKELKAQIHKQDLSIQEAEEDLQRNGEDGFSNDVYTYRHHYQQLRCI